MSSTATIEWTLGDRLAKARRTKGWSQSELATQLGIGRRSISRYEDDIARPSKAVLIAWAEVTGAPLAWLEGAVTQANTGGYSRRFAALVGNLQVSGFRHPALSGPTFAM